MLVRSPAGVIPQELGKLHMLKDIAMTYINVNGTIPEGIFNISSLKFIAFSGNNLVGRLPTGIGYALKYLEEFYLISNFLSGVIPDSISNCSRLSIISFSDNQFSGALPTFLGNLRLLERLYLDGAIPKEIGNLTTLELISIGSNNFGGWDATSTATASLGGWDDDERLQRRLGGDGERGWDSRRRWRRQTLGGLKETATALAKVTRLDYWRRLQRREVLGGDTRGKEDTATLCRLLPLIPFPPYSFHSAPNLPPRQCSGNNAAPHSALTRRRTGSDALGSRTNMLNPSSLTSLSPKPILISSNPFSPSQHQMDSATVIRRCQERMEKQIHHHHLTPPRTEGETDLLPSSDAAKNGWRNRSATIVHRRCRNRSARSLISG
nr:receptor kinase-like protein Xa21 isoform X1 [Ipomoea batatas]